MIPTISSTVPSSDPTTFIMSPSQPPTHYDVLGIRHDATPEEIRYSFRNRSLQTHPDKVGDTPENNAAFRVVKEARDVLCDPALRARYDASLRNMLSLEKTTTLSFQGRPSQPRETTESLYRNYTSSPQQPRAPRESTPSWQGYWPGKIFSTTGNWETASQSSEDIPNQVPRYPSSPAQAPNLAEEIRRQSRRPWSSRVPLTQLCQCPFHPKPELATLNIPHNPAQNACPCISCAYGRNFRIKQCISNARAMSANLFFVLHNHDALRARWNADPDREAYSGIYDRFITVVHQRWVSIGDILRSLEDIQSLQGRLSCLRCEFVDAGAVLEKVERYWRNVLHGGRISRKLMYAVQMLLVHGDRWEAALVGEYFTGAIGWADELGGYL